MKTEKAKYNVLILGASYGSLLATKLLLAGHDVTLVCRETTARLINAEGTIVRVPIRGRDTPIELLSKTLSGTLSAMSPEKVDLDNYDLVVLAMQEPQYSASGVRELVQRIALSRKPTMAITNMPLLPYLRRIPGVNVDEKSLASACFTEPSLWKDFDPARVTQCSPDPQAYRPPDEPANVLIVKLPTNFKAAKFVNPADTAMLEKLQDDVQAARFAVRPDGNDTQQQEEQLLQVPVKLRVYDSVFCPLAKWAMLLAGNYRCVEPYPQEMRSIQHAVCSDLDKSRAIYDWVVSVCTSLGGSDEDFVPFDKYAAAARSLGKPSSAARALADGATTIERVDKLVAMIAAQQGKQLEAVDATVARVDEWLQENKKDQRSLCLLLQCVPLVASGMIALRESHSRTRLKFSSERVCAPGFLPRRRWYSNNCERHATHVIHSRVARTSRKARQTRGTNWLPYSVMDLSSLLELNEGTVIADQAGMGRVVIATRSVNDVGTTLVREKPAIVWLADDWREFLRKFQESSPSLKEAVLDMFHPPLTSEAMLPFESAARQLVQYSILDDVDLIHKLLAIVQTNGHDYYGSPSVAYSETYGFPGATRGTKLCALFVYGSKVAHSCSPNTAYSSKTHDGCLEYKVIRSIKEGDVVTFSYLDKLFLTPTRIRREKLLVSKSFVCKCQRCTGPDFCRFLHCPTTGCNQNMTGIDSDATLSTITWICPSCGVLEEDAANRQTKKEKTIERELESLKLLTLMSGGPSRGSLASAKALVTKAAAQLSRVHFITLKAMRHYTTIAASFALESEQMSMMGFPTHPSLVALRLKAAESGFALVSACECVAAGCCRKHCKVANVSNHEPLFECAINIFHACQDLIHVPSIEWPTYANSMVERYVPLMAICFGEDDVDVRAIERAIASNATGSSVAAIGDPPGRSSPAPKSSTDRLVKGGKKNRKKKRGKKK